MSGDTFTSNRFAWLEAIAADSELSSHAARAAIVISSHLSRTKGDAWPSIKTIAACAGSPRRTVERAIAELCKAGYLERRRRGFSLSNSYVIPDTSPHRCNADLVSIPATGGGNGPDSPAKGGGNDDAIPAMCGGSVPPPLADHSRHEWRTNPLIEPIEDNPKEETYPPASEIEVSAAARESSPPDWKQGFEAFWVQYPRKKGKGAAEKAYKAALKIVGAETLMAACLRFSAAEDAAYRKGKEAQYTPHASTWLNRRSWEDEPDPVVTEVNRPAATNADRKALQADVALMLKGHARSIRTEDSPAFAPEAQLLRIAR